MTTTLPRDLGNISAQQAVQWFFGITPSDLKVTANNDAGPAAIEHSRTAALLGTLTDRLQYSGYDLGAADAYKVEVPLNRHHPEKAPPVVDLISYQLRRDGKNVGYAYHFWGPQGGLVLAKATRWDGSYEAFFSGKDEIERVVFDRTGLVVSSTTELQPPVVPAGISCQDLCRLICESGTFATFAECFAACAETGPGEVICDPLCTLLISLGCAFGCDNICDLCC